MDAAFWTRAFDELAAAFGRAEAVLCGYDGAIGDGDHGSSMLRGFQEAQASLRDPTAAGPGEVWVRTGEAFVENVGGVTGMVFGSLFGAGGRHAVGLTETDAGALHGMFAAGLAEVKKVGKAREGDKSMVDALAPAVEALKKAAENGLTGPAALREAAWPPSRGGMRPSAWKRGSAGRATRPRKAGATWTPGLRRSAWSCRPLRRPPRNGRLRETASGLPPSAAPSRSCTAGEGSPPGRGRSC